MSFATIDVAFDVMPSPSPISQGRTTKNSRSHDEFSNYVVTLLSLFVSCEEIL